MVKHQYTPVVFVIIFVDFCLKSRGQSQMLIFFLRKYSFYNLKQISGLVICQNTKATDYNSLNILYHFAG